MADYDLGDAPAFRAYIRDPDGVLVAATVVATFTDPSGATSTPSVTTDAVGVYDVTAPVLDEAGMWILDWGVTGAVTDKSTVQFTVSDPGPVLYASLHIVKKAVFGPNAEDMVNVREDLLLLACEAASRMCENTCERVFYRSAVAEAKVIQAIGRTYHNRKAGLWELRVPDLATLDDMVVEIGSGSTWTDITSGVDALTPELLGRPYTWLRRRAGDFGRLDVRITARWGYPSIPPEVRMASQLQAARLYRRKDSPEGVTGNAEWGIIRLSRLDPDFGSLVADHMRLGVGG